MHISADNIIAMLEHLTRAVSRNENVLIEGDILCNILQYKR